jgi:hypothetical protein
LETEYETAHRSERLLRPSCDDGARPSSAPATSDWRGHAGRLGSAGRYSGNREGVHDDAVGDLEGMILTDGTEVHVPPHLSTQLAAAVRPGESVRVFGWRSSIPNFVVAASLTGQRGQSVVDQGPPPPGMRPPPPPPGQPAPGAQQATVQGRVQQILHGPRGDVNGALLDDGTILKFPPPLAWRASSTLQPGQVVTVQGWALSTSYGRVVDAQTIGAGPTQVTQTPPAPLPPLPAPPSGGAAPPPPRAGMAPPPPPPAPRQ